MTSSVSVITVCSNVYHVHGLSLTSTGNILLTTDNGQIMEYTPSGLLVQQFTIGTYSYQALEISNNIWVVSEVGFMETAANG